MSHREPGVPSIWQFFDPNSPWVLVHEGSIKGYFDYVPRHLRVGPWASLATIYLVTIVAKLLYWMPQKTSFHLDDEILSAHPIAYTTFWVYNVAVFFWMNYVLLSSMRNRGPWILFTYTIQSWTMLTIRHGLSALAPFLPRTHVLLWINEILRFPALATASITFFFWNFAIAPAIYFNFDTKRRREFLNFNLSFRLVQVHLFNIIFAIMNTIVVSARQFQFVDLWCGLAGAVGYALLYLLVLDRVGVHLVGYGRSIIYYALVFARLYHFSP